MNSTSAVRQFIIDTFLAGDARRLRSADDPLRECGLVDEVDMLEISTFLEAYFGIEIDDAELQPENLGSLAKIAAFVQRKQAQRPAA